MTDQQRGVCAERLADFKKGHPEFNEFVARWADLLMLQKEVKDGLRFPDAQVFAWTEEEFIGGVPLATKLPAQLFMEPFRESSARMGTPPSLRQKKSPVASTGILPAIRW